MCTYALHHCFEEWWLTFSDGLQDELTETLVRQCHSSQLAVQRLIAESADDDTVLFEALAVHDELEKVLAKHAAMAPPQTHGMTAHKTPSRLGPSFL